MDEGTLQTLATRASLLRRLKDCDDHESWQQFFDLYRDLIHSFALKAGLTESEAEEVVQETVIGVARKIPEFEYQPDKCSFKTWLLNQTVWRIKDQFRKRLPSVQAGLTSDDPARTATVERIADTSEQILAALWEKDWQRTVLTVALQRVKQSANLKDCQMFDLHVVRGLGAREVALSMGVTVARVYLAKHRIGKLVQRQMVGLEKNV
jgi:RNA polymerase sigma-70 factor (ECF subfamily)